MYDHTFLNLQITTSDVRPHIKWAVRLVILHMVTLVFLGGLCGYVWVNILTLSPHRECMKDRGYPTRDLLLFLASLPQLVQ